MNSDRIMNRENDNDEITIDLAELFFVLWSKIHVILLTGILLALVSFVGTKLLVTPKYTSDTKIYVLTKQDSSAGVTVNDLQTGAYLTKDYMELVKSRPVLEQVIAVLNLDIQTEQLSQMITVENASDTRILTIRVESEDPKEAKAIADAVRESVGIQITKIMDADSVNTIEEGNLPTSPSSPNLMKNMALGGILGIVLAIGIIVLIYVLDDTLKTPEDVENFLGLNVLTSIPVSEGFKKSKKVKGMSAKKLMRNMKR